MLYRSYLFTDKDPIIDKMRTAFQDSGKSQAEVSRDSGLSYQTITNWFSGATQRPQHASTEAFFRALGYSLVPTRMSENTIRAWQATDREMKRAEEVWKTMRAKRRAKKEKSDAKRRVAA